MVNLFIYKDFWTLFLNYLTYHVNITNYDLCKQSSYPIFVYTYYRFFHNDVSQIKNISLQNVIKHIEKLYPELILKNFVSFDVFYNRFILKRIVLDAVPPRYINTFGDFLLSILRFEPEDRFDYDELLNHPFIINN